MAKKRRTKSYSKKSVIKAVVAAAFVLVCLAISFISGAPSWGDISKKAEVNSGVIAKDGNFYVHYIDVGQADCELMTCGDDVVMIDAGETDSYNTIDSYLKLNNVSYIDYLILTHAHADHIGSADDIINNYEVKNVIMTRLTEENTPTSDVYAKLLDALSNSDAKVYAAKAGDVYSLQNFSFEILGPVKDYKELNNTSVVLKATFGNVKFLFEGDAEAKSEKDILAAGYDVSADVIKLGHHGSRTSSDLDYLRAVNPQAAIISCGENNTYKHPHPETIAKLDSLSIPYYRTDVRGNIVVECDGNSFTFNCER